MFISDFIEENLSISFFPDTLYLRRYEREVKQFIFRENFTFDLT